MAAQRAFGQLTVVPWLKRTSAFSEISQVIHPSTLTKGDPLFDPVLDEQKTSLKTATAAETGNPSEEITRAAAKRQYEGVPAMDLGRALRADTPEGPEP